MGWPQPHLFRQVCCSLYSNLLPCFSYSLFPWLPFLLLLFFLLFSQLACWSACLMMNSLHGYSDSSVSWQGQAYSLLGYRRPRICSPSPVMSSLGWTALKLTLGLSSRPAQMVWNQRLLATSTSVHSLELVSLIALPRYYFIFLYLGLPYSKDLLGLSYLGIQGWGSGDGHRGRREWWEKNGEIWLKGGKGEHCSFIIFPVQPDRLRVGVLLLVFGDKPGL